MHDRIRGRKVGPQVAVVLLVALPRWQQHHANFKVMYTFITPIRPNNLADPVINHSHLVPRLHCGKLVHIFWILPRRKSAE